MSTIILASGSPRRKLLLNQIGLEFDVQVSKFEEYYPEELTPFELAEFLALQKARDVAKVRPDGLVIGADTIVVNDGLIMGKPRSEDEAWSMLNGLQGKTHQVVTGVGLVDSLKGREVSFHQVTKVSFRPLEGKEIDAYIASGEPMDKAGAYGIQGLGALLVESIEGCYFNVVGLPLNRLTLALKQFGVNILG